MFSRYWRSYPWPLQLLLFILLMFTLMSFGGYLDLVLIPKLTGVPVKEFTNLSANTSYSASRAFIWFQALGHFFQFALPCLLFAHLTHPRPSEYLALTPPSRPVQFLWVTLLIIGFSITMLTIEAAITRLVHLPPPLQQAQDKLESINSGMLQFHGPGDLYRILFVLALIVPFGEELLFRSILMRFAARRTTRNYFPLIITSLLFAAMHYPNVIGLPLIFISGLLLGIIFWFTGSLWCSIWAHALFNGLQICIAYAQHTATPAVPAAQSEHIPVSIIIGAFAAMSIGMVMLYKTATPLSPLWKLDYSPKELLDQQQNNSLEQ